MNIIFSCSVVYYTARLLIFFSCGAVYEAVQGFLSSRAETEQCINLMSYGKNPLLVF